MKALDYDPKFYLAYFQLGVLQKKQGQSKKAIESLKKVIEINPNHEKTWFTLGTAYEADGNNQEAIDHLLPSSIHAGNERRKKE